MEAPDDRPLGWAGSRVKVCRPGKDYRPELVGEVWLDASGALKTTLLDWLAAWEREGIVGRADRGRLYPRDGQRFLDELPYMYKSPYFWAEPT